MLPCRTRSTGRRSKSRRCAAPTRASGERMVEAIDAARNAGDTLGGVVEGRAHGVPIGLGSHVHWDRKIDGRLAQALMSIHSVKGVEIGGGFGATRLTGSHVHDVILPREQWTRPPVGARDEQRRRHRRRHHRRPGRRRARRAEADRHAAALAAVRRPADRRGDRRRTTSAAMSASSRRPASSSKR